MHKLISYFLKNTDQKKSVRNTDYILVVIILVLMAFGLVILYSTSSYNGRVKFDDSAYYFKKQLFATVLGILCMFVVSRIDYHEMIRFAPLVYVSSLILSTLVLFIGDEYNGSKRWLSLGPFSFQPAELAKLAVVLFITWIICKNKKKTGFGLIVKVLILILPIVALVGSNNLSTAVIILGIAIILIFVSNPHYVQFVGLGGVCILFLGVFLAMESYRLERLAVWRNPEAYDKGFQTLQGLLAIGSGGLFGNGLGNSMQKLGFVPEAQNDMIFSIICEELGLIGAGFVILLFGVLIYRLFKISMGYIDLEGLLVSAGIMAHIALQVILNIAVVTNTIPNTGITLPFISYGGTSVLFLLSEMGLAISVSQYSNRRV